MVWPRVNRMNPKTRRKYNQRKEVKETHRQDARKYRKAHPKKIKEYERKRRLSGRDKESKWKMRGIKMTIKEYNKKFKKQKGCCMICGKHQDQLDRKLCVDHNHTTGQVRGLLCSNCNLLVGRIETEEREAAQMYLEKWASVG